MADLIMRQALSVIDERTSVVCLHIAGDIVPVDEPFETLAGEFMEPPFHIHCRTIVGPWMPGMAQRMREEANAELQNRPLDQRRLGPAGEIGMEIPAPSPFNPPTGPKFSLADDPDDYRPMGLSRRLDLSNEQYRELVEKFKDYSRGDDMLKWIMEEQGFASKPKGLTEEEWEEIVERGVPIYRGLTEQKFVDQMLDGDLFAGKGVYGNGLYFTVDRRTAVFYANSNDDLVTEMVLRPGARVIDFADAERQMEDELEAEFDKKDRSFDKVSVLGDPGRWAAARGYDAIRAVGMGEHGEDFYVVLNRGALYYRKGK